MGHGRERNPRLGLNRLRMINSMTEEQHIYPVDLQTHSTCSDGTDTPTELVNLAASLGIGVMALTDHDSVMGIDEAIRAGEQTGVEIVPALEFSTEGERERDFLDVNILAYGIRHHDPTLQAVLKQVVDARVDQKIRQTERLQRYGVKAPVDEVLALAKGVPGRVHIAKVALKHNPEKFKTISDVFEQYLAATAPNSTYAKREFSLRVEECIEITHQAGGLAVLAHPGVYDRMRDVDDVIRRLSLVGLDGLEVNYTYAQNRGHYGASQAEVAALIEHFDGLADRYNLLKSGGSDYHGKTKPGIVPGLAGLEMDDWGYFKSQILSGL